MAIGGNIPLTTTMLHGTQQDNMKWVLDLLDSIDDKLGLIVAPGCDMPFHVPADNTIGVVQALLVTNQVREMLKNYVATEEEDIPVELPDYEHLKKPLVEIFTLDPATCAACTYMVSAVDEVKPQYGDKVDFALYRYTIKEDIARCRKMGVTNLPCIYINGQLKFKSIIPGREELVAAIDGAF